jgi:hypothetical protein
MSEWQPIASAPKDGTRVLICNAEGDSYHWAYVARCKRTRWLVLEANNGRTVHVASDPTHWMPMPSPPACVLEKP